MDALLARGEPVRMVNRSGGAPYDQWEEQFPRLQAGVLAAAQAHSARLVSMENVDMYGRPNGQPLTETRAHRAHTHQGRLRSRMSNRAAERAPVRPGRGDHRARRGLLRPAWWRAVEPGDRVVPPALAGRTASVLGDPDQPHTYTHRRETVDAYRRTTAS